MIFNAEIIQQVFLSRCVLFPFSFIVLLLYIEQTGCISVEQLMERGFPVGKTGPLAFGRLWMSFPIYIGSTAVGINPAHPCLMLCPAVPFV
jgi:hypothetical protein